MQKYKNTSFVLLFSADNQNSINDSKLIEITERIGDNFIDLSKIWKKCRRISAENQYGSLKAKNTKQENNILRGWIVRTYGWK